MGRAGGWGGWACYLLLFVWVIIGMTFGPYEKNITLKDGRVIHCLAQNSMFAKSISCDWDHPVKTGSK